MPDIDMNQPWIYLCSPSRSPLPPPCLPSPSGSSQCTSPEHLSHASNLGWWSVSHLIVYMFLGIHTEETRSERDMCTPMFITALFIIARTWKQPRCPSASRFFSIWATREVFPHKEKHDYYIIKQSYFCVYILGEFSHVQLFENL